MYELQTKIRNLETKNIDVVMNTLRTKLTTHGVTVPSGASLRAMIGLIPAAVFRPIDLEKPSLGHTAINTNDRQILFCGGSTPEQKLYDTSSNTFTSKRMYPTSAVNHHAGVLHGSDVYYVGNYATNYNAHRVYIPRTDTFANKSNLTINISKHRYIHTIRFMLVMGGQLIQSTEQVSNKIFAYDVALNRFQARVNLPYAMQAHAAAYVTAELISLMGGRGTGTGLIDTNIVFDAARDVFTTKQNMPQGEDAIVSHKVDDNSVLKVGQSTLTFNITTNTFTRKRTPPTRWFYATLTKTRNDYLISGGTTNAGVSRKQYSYNLQRDEYTTS